MPTLTVDGVEVTVEHGTTILQACEEAGAEIPRFCYHERLSIAGNCRMCLVELEKAPKPIASCAMPAGDGMVIHTDTPTVKRAREGVMEFLLINHPLDCPICDQGGECDLQDQAMAYGRHFSRFGESKRAVKDKDVGPLIETIMTRCIHCTRCIRFADEIAGVEEFGAVFRGEHMEIGTYVEQAVSSELSGNMIDLCPVGALTSKPYAFNARSWELDKTESIDVMDAVGSNIRIDVRSTEVLRIVPRLNDDINEEWISDKSRFAYDGLRRRRLDKCFVRQDGKLHAASWDEAFNAIAAASKDLSGGQMAAIAGDLADCESMTALKDLMAALGSPHIDCRQDGAKIGGGPREGYLFNTTIYGIEDADVLLLIGSNPRLEAPVLNARIRKTWLENDLQVGVIGEPEELTYPYAFLGGGPSTLKDMVESDHMFTDMLKTAKRPMLILGQGALARADGAAVLRLAAELAEKTGMLIAPSEELTDGWNGFSVLHTAAARVAGLDLGFLPSGDGRDVAGILDGAESGAIETVFLLGADEIDASRLEKAFVIYLGHHGDAGAHAADVILPGAAYTEKNATFVNTEGRVQFAHRAVFPKGDAREDWAILRALSDHVGRTLPYDDLDALREKLREDHPTFAALDYAPGGASAGSFDVAGVGKAGAVDAAAFQGAVTNFFFTNAIARASQTLAEAAAATAAARGELQAAE